MTASVKLLWDEWRLLHVGWWEFAAAMSAVEGSSSRLKNWSNHLKPMRRPQHRLQRQIAHGCCDSKLLELNTNRPTCRTVAVCLGKEPINYAFWIFNSFGSGLSSTQSTGTLPRRVERECSFPQSGPGVLRPVRTTRSYGPSRRPVSTARAYRCCFRQPSVRAVQTAVKNSARSRGPLRRAVQVSRACSPEFKAVFIFEILRDVEVYIWRCTHTAGNGKYNDRRKSRYWQQLPFAFCVRPDVAENHVPSCWVRSWLRRDESGFSNNLVRQLERDDKAEYKSTFSMDTDSFQRRNITQDE